jgi:hypothetical protein
VTPSIVEIAVNGVVHRVAVPVEWSGGLAFVVNVHHGQASKKLLIGRLAAILLEHGTERGPRLESGDSAAVGGPRSEEEDGRQEEAPEGCQGEG